MTRFAERAPLLRSASRIAVGSTNPVQIGAVRAVLVPFPTPELWPGDAIVETASRDG